MSGFLTYTKQLLTNPYFYAGLIALGLLGTLALVLMDKVVMPSFTRQGDYIEVPNVVDLNVEEAERLLEEKDLQVFRNVQRYNPMIERDAVVDQNPAAAASVKKGRRIYLEVNSGTTPIVAVPQVLTFSVQEARSQIMLAGLRVGDVRPDPIPGPYANSVTKTDPPPGSSVDQGSAVVVWYSTGMGNTYVDVPDVRGLTVREAEAALLALRLRSIALDTSNPSEETIKRQSMAPGTRAREGSEIRLFVKEREELDLLEEVGVDQ